MKRHVIIILVMILLLTTGCAASRGEGISVGNGFINTGASQETRNQVVQERTQAEIDKVEADTAMQEAKTQAGIEQGALTGEVWRKVLLWGGLAAAVAGLAIGIGYAGKQVTPLAGQAVAALETTLEIRKVKRLEVSVEIGVDGYVGHLLAEGYTRDEIADLVHQNPALDGPKVLALQGQVGDRGMRALADRGELEETLVRLSETVEVETIEKEEERGI